MFGFFKKGKPRGESGETSPAKSAGPPRKTFLSLYGSQLDQETILARELLDGRAVPYSYVDVTDDDTTRRWLRKKTGSAALPQLFIDEKPIGDYGALREIEYRGDLDRLLSGELRPEDSRPERADAAEVDPSRRDAQSIRERLRQGEILGLTLPDGSSFDCWAEVYANPPLVYYEGIPYPIEKLDEIVEAIGRHIAGGASFTWREDD